MKEHPMKESEYLMAPLVKCAADNKEKKKAARKENIRKGSKLRSAGLCWVWFLTFSQWRTSRKDAKNSKRTCSPVYHHSIEYHDGRD